MSVSNPYESPATIDEPSLELSPEVFRGKFWPVYWVATLSSWLISVLICTLMGMPLDTPIEWLMSVVTAIGACLALTGFLTLFFTIHISPRDIYGFDFWGAYHRVPWTAVERGQPVNLMGLRYMRLIAPGYPTLWVPLYLHRMDEFVTSVHAWTTAFDDGNDEEAA